MFRPFGAATDIILVKTYYKYIIKENNSKLVLLLSLTARKQHYEHLVTGINIFYTLRQYVLKLKNTKAITYVQKTFIVLRILYIYNPFRYMASH